MRELGASLSRATIGKSRADAVRDLVAAYRAFVKRHPGIYAATMIAPEPADREIKRASDEIVEICVSVLSGYGFGRRDAIHAVRAMRSAVHGFAGLETAGGFGIPVDVDKSFEWMVTALLSGLESASKMHA
jgi:WHG domain-containing protein